MRFVKLIVAASAPLAIAAMAMLGSSCGGSGSECSATAQKQYVLETAQDWYLFQPLPAVNPSDYATADELLYALTAQERALSGGKQFSYVTTRQAEAQFFEDGQAIAFGLRTELVDNHLMVARVEPDSPAQGAGFLRGDDIIAIGDSPDTLVPVQSMSDAQLSGAFGPAQRGVVRWLQVHPRDATSSSQTELRVMSKDLITLDPVPKYTVLPGNIGYVSLESFIDPATAQLETAFAFFQSHNVHDVIVDLRYNGGGLIDVATSLASLLAADHAGDPMFSYRFNQARALDNDETVPFLFDGNAITADRIAFIATDATASASELVINALDPYTSVAIIGGSTYGKPVGQDGFDMPGCDLVLRLIAFRTINSVGHGDYYQGLPDSQFQGDFCTATDDLQHERDDVAEDSTSTAISWLDNGTCPSAKSGRFTARFLRPQQRTPAQDDQPGLF